MTGAEALVYARSRHGSTATSIAAGASSGCSLSLREQDDIAVAHRAASGASRSASQSRSRPTSRSSELPKLLGPRRQRRHEEHPLVRVRAAVLRVGDDPARPRLHHQAQHRTRSDGPSKDAFRRRPRCSGPARRAGRRGGAASGCSTGPARGGPTRPRRRTSTYDGIDASAPNQKPRHEPAATKIVVYNGAEAEIPGDDQVPRGPVQREGHDRDRPEGARVDIDHDDWRRNAPNLHRSTRSADPGRRPGPAGAPRRTARWLVVDGREPVAYSGRRPRTASK